MNGLVKNISSRNITFYLFVVIIFIAGIYIRARYYLANAPMWLDEIMLASSFSNRTFSEIFLPLDAFQKAPPLFCFFVLTLSKLFGFNELTLRFIPFLLNIASIFAFFFLLKENIKNKIGVLAGLFMFTFCVPLVYFSAEFKPYGCDVFFAILLLLAHKHLKLDYLNIKTTFLYTFGAVIFSLLSFPSMILIPAIILSKSIENKKFDLKNLWILGGIFLSGLSLILYDIKSFMFLKAYWGNVEGGFSLLSLFGLEKGFIQNACSYFVYNLNTNFIIIILCMILCGLIILFKENKNKAYLVLLIFFFAIISSLFNLYPLSPKLALYILPVFILLISKFFDMFLYCPQKKSTVIYNILAVIVLILTIGINIPYLNMSENNLVYYNKNVNGRNKSLNDRLAVKNFSIKILDNYKSGDKIVASEEFLYAIKYYKANKKYNRKIKITTFNDITETTVENITEFINDFIKNNQTSKKLLFIGRNNEEYFKCADAKILEEIIKQNGLKYKKESRNDLYYITVYK